MRSEGNALVDGQEHSELSAISITDIPVHKPNKKKNILIVAGAAFLILGLGIVIAFAAGAFDSTSEGSSTGKSIRDLVVPESLKIVSKEDSNSNGARPMNFAQVAGKFSTMRKALHSHKAALQENTAYANFETAHQEIQEDIDISGMGFNSVIKMVENIICIISKTRFDLTELQNPSQYYAARVDMRQCGEGTLANETSMLEVDVRVRDISGYDYIDIYMPGYVGNIPGSELVHSPRRKELQVWATLRQDDMGFDFTFKANSVNAKDDSTGAYLDSRTQMDGFLKYINESNYYYYSEAEYQTHIVDYSNSVDRWENQTGTASCSVQGKAALISNQIQPTGQNFSYLLTYDGSHILVQNCTHGCDEVSELDFFVYGDDTTGTCYSQNWYTPYDYNYCLYKVGGADAGNLLTTDVTTYWNYAPETSLRGDNDINLGFNPFRVQYSVYPGHGCEIELWRCENRTSLNGTYEGGCYPGMATTEGLYNEYIIDTGGYGANTASFKEGTPMPVGDSVYQLKALKQTRVLKKANVTGACSNIKLRVPFWDNQFPGGSNIPLARPYMMYTPENYGFICHGPGQFDYCVNTGERIGDVSFFTPVASSDCPSIPVSSGSQSGGQI